MNKKYESFPPWITRNKGHCLQSLKLAKSTDSIHFEKLEHAILERGGATSHMITDYDNERIVAIFDYFSFEKEEEFNKLAVSFSYDEGKNWTKPQIINLEAPEVIRLHSCGPTLVLIDDGKYRLYFSYPEGSVYEAYPNAYPFPRILSAISEDCINFSIEKGVRFMIEGEFITNPSIIAIGDKWHYYSPIVLERNYWVKGKNYHAVSKDGLNFTRLEDIKLDMQMLGCAIAVKDGYRFYGTGPKGMTAFSEDGYNWIQEDVKTLGPDPGVVRLKDGTYLMVYTAGHE